MPDNFYHIDEPLTDQGWSEMKKLLDREMPVRPVPFFRRRKGWLWLLLLLLPLGVVWGYYQFGKGEKARNTAPPATAPADREKPVAQASSGYDCIEIQTTEKPEAGRKTVPPANRIANAPRPAIVISEPIAEMERDGGLIQESVLAPLAGLRFHPVPRQWDIQPQVVTAAVRVSQEKAASRSWNAGLEVGPFANSGFRSAGIGGGVVLGRSFGKSKWGFQTGVGYSRFSRPFPSQTLSRNLVPADFQNQFDSNENIILIDSLNTIEDYASSTDSSVYRLHFLEIPLVLTWQPADRWQFHAGAGVGVLLFAQNESGEMAGSGLFRTQKAAEDMGPGTGAVVPEAIVQHVPLLNPYFEGGLTFYPLKRLGVGAQVNFGLRDMLSNWPGEQFVNRAQLKVSYWLR